jgi:3-oxoacyl-[acyl-carrier-protein] synthase-3
MIEQIASCLPDQILTNDVLVQELGRWTPDEVFAKTGIRQRCIAAPGQTALDLGADAVQKLLAGRKRDADFLILCTQTGDYKLPSSACLLQARTQLPTTCGALDINLACSGFIYGLAVAEGLLATGSARQVVLVNSDTYTHYIHPQDAACRPIFGDGAAATLLTQAGAGRILGFEFGTDGAHALNMYLPAGGEKHREFRPAIPNRPSRPDDPEFIRMNGPEIYNFTLHVVPAAVNATLRKSERALADVDYFVFHQANAFMLESLRRKMNLPREKFIIEMATTGNLVSASIPVVLERMLADGRLRPGMRTLLCGFGVGLSWASCLVEW